MLGVFFEEAEQWLPSGKPRLDMTKGTLTPSRWHKRKKQMARIGWILIILGVAGEGSFEAAVFSADGRLQDFNDTLLASATEQAGDAAQSAKTAHVEADAVGKEADALKTRLDTASRQLSQFEKNIDPRAKLLTGVAPELATKLAPFAGQRVGLFVCGQQGLTEQETIDAWAAIANILGPGTVSGVTGANWKEVPTNLNFTGGCGAAKGLGQGIMVSVSKRASKKTMEAASVLSDGLTKALPPSPEKMQGIVDVDFWQRTLRDIPKGLLEDRPSLTMMANDPDLIVVTIGEHP